MRVERTLLRRFVEVWDIDPDDWTALDESAEHIESYGSLESEEDQGIETIIEWHVE